METLVAAPVVVQQPAVVFESRVDRTIDQLANPLTPLAAGESLSGNVGW